MPFVVLGLGSNRQLDGEPPVRLLARACVLLGEFVDGLEVSSVYRTAALYVTDQADFLNMVACGTFTGTPRELLAAIHRVEAALGRDRSREYRNGPRTMDIDIELFGREQVRESDLVIPHERLTERAFVLLPLLEILTENADVTKNDVDSYAAALSRLPEQRAERFMERTAFRQLLGGVQ